MIINNTTIPTLNNIASNTSIIYGGAGSQNIPEATYYNLTLSGSGDKLLQTGTSGVTTVNNVLTIDPGVNFNNQGNNVVILGNTNGISNSGTASGNGRFIYSLQDASTSITGSASAVYSNLEMDFSSSTGATRTLTLGNTATISGTLYLTDGTFANASNLTMASGSTIALADGILSSFIVSSSGYDVIYNPYTSASPKATGNEISGSLRNFTLQTGSGLAINLNRNLILSGTLALISGTLDPTVTNYNLTVAGNFTNNATLISRNNNVSFNGSSTQSISGSAAQSFYDLTINKAAADIVQLNTPISVSHGLVLTNGIVTTSNTNLLTLASAVSIIGGSSTSYIEGPLRHTVDVVSGSRNFPVGKNNAYRPVTLNLTQVSASSTTYTAEVFTGAPPTRTLPATIDRVSTVRYFTVNSSNNSNLSSATIMLNYDVDDVVTDPINLRIAKSNGSNWENIGGTGTGSGSGSITSVNFTAFSDFVLANAVGGLNPLPLHWLSFKGIVRGKNIQLTWQTADEENTDRFEIQRGNSQGEWTEIGRVQSRNGTLNDYEFTDNKPITGINYYRIKSVDSDGSVSYSAIVSVRLEDPIAGISIVPNPVTGTSFSCHIYDTDLLREQAGLLQIFDMNGKLVVSRIITPRPVIQVQGTKLTAGTYLLRIRAAEKYFFRQIMVQ